MLGPLLHLPFRLAFVVRPEYCLQPLHSKARILQVLDMILLHRLERCPRLSMLHW